jgi:hypothetical protein
MNADAEDFTGFDNSRPHLVGGGGPLVIKSKHGHLLQIIDFDIGQLASQLDPGLFHVTSQPIPAMVEGGVFQYEVKVNNPGAVSGYRMRSPTTGASISNSGALRFSAPQNVKVPIQIDFSIEILDRNGRTVLHNFPLLVLPRKVSDIATPALTAPQRR